MVGEPVKRTVKKQVKRQMRDDHLNSVGVSNATNSRSPDDLRSRVFIGNLNTTIVTKRQLHFLFQEYGDIRAISMHKGYAFIQYADEMDALNAVLAQDGQLLSGQAIDVNLVTEPKPHQRACKKVTNDDENENEKGKDMETETETEIDPKQGHGPMQGDDLLEHLDIISNQSEETHRLEPDALSNGMGSQIPQIPQDEGPAESEKEWKDSSSNSSSTFSAPLLPSSTGAMSSEPTTNKRLKTDAPALSLAHIQPQLDIMICGNCRTLFTSISSFIQHKKRSKCRLRFVCHCNRSQEGPQLCDQSVAPTL